MELKVWCDGIQRVVCGATSTTTCQDIVFALAHATCQTGRFILIEKWRNTERVLAPSDWPLASLSKRGEFAHEVTFIMKRSGDVISHTKPKSIEPACHDTRKVEPTMPMSKSMPLIDTRNYATLGSGGLSQHSGKLGYMSHPSSSRMIEQNIGGGGSSSGHEMNSDYDTFMPDGRAIRDKMARRSAHQISSASLGAAAVAAEPLYGTLGGANRPRQPPPYQEAVARSSLANKMGSEPIYEPGRHYHQHQQQQQQSQLHPHHAHLQPPKTSSHHNQQPPQQIANTSYTAPNNANNNAAATSEEKRLKRNSDILAQHHQMAKSLSSLHQETMNIIDMQKRTLMKQDRDIANVENEITMVEHKMSENNLAAKRFKEEMDYLQQLWQQQEMLIQTLEAENVEGELHQLVEEENRSEAELQEVKHKLAHCEQQLEHCKQQICDLMDKINEEAGKPLSSDHLEVDDEKAMIDKLQMAIGEKNKELELQNENLSSLTESIDHFDKLLQDKNELIEKLTIEIKEANVEGLAMQAGALYVEERSRSSLSPNEPASATTTTANESTISRNGSTRKISVAPHELGHTVPTKKNPDGIWV